MRLLILCLFIWALQGCHRINKLTAFNLYYSKTVVVPSSTLINLPINLPTPDFTTNSESSFSNNGTRADLIESININQLNLTIDNPANGNFNFLKSVSVFLSSPQLPEIRIAWKDSIPSANSNFISLDLTNENLSPYLKSDTIKLKLSTITDELITSDYTIDIQSRFHVKAKLISK